MTFITVFVLAAFVGYEVVSKVPSILHTPLMSGSNAIHGIILVGTMLVLGQAHGPAQLTLGFLAVVLATLNVVGGFVVTDRMLQMFKAKPPTARPPPARRRPRPTVGRPARHRHRDGDAVVSRATATDLVYLVAIVGFILALKGLSSPKRARLGNLVGAAGMLVAVAWTFSLPAVYSHTRNLVLIIVAIAIGAVIGVPAARLVKMTAMPQMVAIFNGVGGGAAALVSVTEFISLPGKSLAIYKICEILFGVLVGSVSFAGSAVAFAKLQELMTGRPITYPAQQPINAAIGARHRGPARGHRRHGQHRACSWSCSCCRWSWGRSSCCPSAGADTPVLISLLNAFTGLAVAASGFTLNSTLLIVAGTLVGASGTLLTRMMSQAMGRSLPNILFSAFGSVVTAIGRGRPTPRVGRCGPGPPRTSACSSPTRARWPSSPATAWPWPRPSTRRASSPTPWRRAGVEVYYAIHPVAGRMPGHMNVLLAEANVPYDQLEEMDDANQDMPTTDVALVVGANDTVNPAAKNTPGSPIYGMPIINADQATNIVFLKRSMRPGFAGIDNELLYDPKTTMLFGDAKDSLSKLVAAVKAA